MPRRPCGHWPTRGSRRLAFSPRARGGARCRGRLRHGAQRAWQDGRDHWPPEDGQLWIQQAQGTSVADAGDGRSPVYPRVQSEQVDAGCGTGRQVRRKGVRTRRTEKNSYPREARGRPRGTPLPSKEFCDTLYVSTKKRGSMTHIQTDRGHLIGIIGAGPAGLYAAKKLVEAGAHVVLFNRDIKPGGLAEYGIFPTKHKMKEGLRKQFRRILAHPQVDYYGNCSVGEKGELTLADLQTLGFDALICAAGAQGTKNLGLPGEDAVGVCHAKDLVYHYNHLPPFSQRHFPIGKRVAIIGMGNVMIDIAHFLLRLWKNVEEVIVVARRGPAERKYDEKEYKYIEAFVAQEALRQEIARLRPALEAVGQDADRLMAEMTTATPPA